MTESAKKISITSIPELIKSGSYVFKSDTDPGNNARAGDIWINSSNTVKVRNFQETDWITIS